VPESETLTTAAVLVPVFRDADGELRVVLVVRSDFGVHGGQLGLPGGTREPGDASLLDTALRESEEELGLARSDVDVLAELEALESQRTGFRVFPFLARVPRDSRWRLHPREVVGVVAPAVATIADPARRAQVPFTSTAFPDGMLVEGITVEGHVLWGLTLRLLTPLAPRLLAGEWPL
jgi:8-oxo-dGTP pyrophosphatase MutT (NUDIX family)